MHTTCLLWRGCPVKFAGEIYGKSVERVSSRAQSHSLSQNGKNMLRLAVVCVKCTCSVFALYFSRSAMAPRKQVLWNHGASLGIWNRNELLYDAFSRGCTDRKKSSALNFVSWLQVYTSAVSGYRLAVKSYMAVLWCCGFGIYAMINFINYRAY